MAKVQIGFDIGTSELKIVQCGAGGIRRVVAEPLPGNLVREGRIISFDAMAEFIRKTARAHRISGRDCAVVLPAEQSYLRRVTLPAMSVEQLAVNLPYEFRDYLTLGKDKYFYDYAVNELLCDEAGTPRELDLTGVATEKQVISDYVDMFRHAGFHLRTAAPVECAYLNLFRAAKGRAGSAVPEEYCILDLGHTATRIHVFNKNRFETTRIIEIGTGAVDEALAEALGVDEHLAKTHKESNLNGAQELDSAKSVYGAVAVEVMKAINFYGFNNPESNLRHAYYCGGGAKIDAMVAAIASASALTMHAIEELLPAAQEADPNLRFCAAAVGATMQ